MDRGARPARTVLSGLRTRDDRLARRTGLRSGLSVREVERSALRWQPGTKESRLAADGSKARRKPRAGGVKFRRGARIKEPRAVEEFRARRRSKDVRTGRKVRAGSIRSPRTGDQHADFRRRFRGARETRGVACPIA